MMHVSLWLMTNKMQDSVWFYEVWNIVKFFMSALHNRKKEGKLSHLKEQSDILEHMLTSNVFLDSAGCLASGPGQEMLWRWTSSVKQQIVVFTLWFLYKLSKQHATC